MAYTKTSWVNNSAPAINATNLNKIEQGIYDNADAIDNLYFKTGDTFNKTYDGVMPCAGLVTTSTTTVFFTVVLPKRLDNVSAVTVDALIGGMRGVSGYVNGTSDSSDLKSGYTVTALILDSQTIRIQITKASVMSNVTNNTPVAVSLKTLNLTFA